MNYLRSEEYSKFIMTCYFRYKKMKELLDRAGIEVTEENKKELDKQIHELVGIDYKNCSDTWKEIKKRMEVDEEDFLRSLKTFM